MHLEINLSDAQMKKSIYLTLMFFCLMTALSSCFKDSEIDYENYNECAITSFVLKDIEWTDTLPDMYGADSTFTHTVTGSSYKFTIDQEKNLIYNRDSLPVGTPVNKVMVTVVSDGLAAFQYDSDSEFHDLEKDTLDFTKPVSAVITSYSGSNVRKYSLKLNVHKQHADSTQWIRNAGVWVGKDLKAPKAVTFGERVAVFGTQEGKLLVTTAAQNSMEWSLPAPVEGVSENARYDNMVCFQNALYVVDNETLFVSDDAIHWTQTSDAPVSCLLGCNSTELFAVYDQTFITSADAQHWNAEETEYPAFIPDSNIFSFFAPFNTNTNLERTVAFGQLKESKETTATAWFRDNGNMGNNGNLWAYMYTSADNDYALPNLNNLVILNYKNYLIAFGNECRNRGNVKAFERLFVSKDWGLTWKSQKDETYETYLKLPSALLRNKQEFAAYVDREYNLWILMTGTGDIWHGYQNKMKFAE